MLGVIRMRMADRDESELPHFSVDRELMDELMPKPRDLRRRIREGLHA